MIMKNRLVAVACRRKALLEKIDAQRAEMADISLLLQKPLAVADAGLKAVRYMRSHPALVAGCIAALLAWRRKGISGLMQEVRHFWYLLPSVVSLAIRSPSCERDHTESGTKKH